MAQFDTIYPRGHLLIILIRTHFKVKEAKLTLSGTFRQKCTSTAIIFLRFLKTEVFIVDENVFTRFVLAIVKACLILAIL